MRRMWLEWVILSVGGGGCARGDTRIEMRTRYTVIAETGMKNRTIAVIGIQSTIIAVISRILFGRTDIHTKLILTTICPGRPYAR